MKLLHLRYITNFKHYFLRVIFNIPGIIVLVSFIRFLYFVYIKKKHKTYYPMESKPDFMGTSQEGGDTALQHNTEYISSFFKDLPRRVVQFNAARSLIPIWPLKALDFTRFINMKVLSIGPRMESELFKLVSLGFQLKNIKSIDIQSYSDLIELADMLKMPYEDNSFDLVIIGYVITYTNEPQKAIDEVVRVLKNKGIVTMCHSHALEFPQKGYSKVHINSSKVMLDFFGNNLDYVYFKYHPFDDKSENRNYGRSNYLIRVKK